MQEAAMIAENPVNAVKNPAMFFAAQAIVAAMGLVRWTRNK
jgi:hypothetical protein